VEVPNNFIGENNHNITDNLNDQNSGVERYTSWLDKFFYTTNQVNTIINQVSDYNDEEVRQDIINKLKELLTDKDINHAVVNYFLGLFEYNTESSIKYFMDCYIDDPDCYDVHVLRDRLYGWMRCMLRQ